MERGAKVSAFDPVVSKPTYDFNIEKAGENDLFK